MTKKLIALFVILFAGTFLVFSAKKDQTKIYSADDENYMWYEFKAKQFGTSLKFYAFKNETQRDNRTVQLFNKSGWGLNPAETITEYYNFEAGEKTVLFDEELKPIMKEKGYKYAFTTYRRTNSKETVIYLFTFYYDSETDSLYVHKSYK